MDADKLYRQSKNSSDNKRLEQEKIVGTDNLMAQLVRSDNQIHSMDTKLAVILAFLGVFIGFILTWGTIFEFVNQLALSFYILTLVSILVGGIYVLLGMGSTIVNKNIGLWTHRDIASYDHYHSFAKKKRVQNVEDYQEDIIIQIYITAKVGRDKFEHYRRSLFFTRASVVAFSLTVLIGII